MQKTIKLSGAEYTITDQGKVFGKSGIEIKQRPDTSGYASFTAGKKGNRTRIRTHLIVARLFIPNPNNLPEIDHLDSNRMNPCITNLEWVTHEENISRAHNKGHYKNNIVGEKNPKANLNEQQVLEIRNIYDSNTMTQMEISKHFGIPYSTVHNIVTRQTWKHI